MFNRDLLAYLAGYFDGEGYICMSRKSLTVGVGSADKEVLERFVQLFGIGRVLPKKASSKTRRQAYQWVVSGNKAQAVLRILVPYLQTAKKQLAELALLPTFKQPSKRLVEGEQALRDLVSQLVTHTNNRVTVERRN